MQLIGMIHLPPLPGSPRFGGSMNAVLDHAMNDAQVLIDAGFDSLLIENYGDIPFYKEHVPPHTISAMTVAAHEIRRSFDVQFGVQVLRNDAIAALAIAEAAGASFIRVNVLSGAMLTDQGIIESNAAEVLRYRSMIAPEIKIWADVHVKHAMPLVPLSIEDAAMELAERACADAIIVSGSATGKETLLEDVKRVKSVVNIPVVIGSGVTEENVHQYIPFADALIIGTSIKKDGVPTNPVDEERAERLVKKVKSSR